MFQTESVIRSFIVAMIFNPHVAKKAQAQIDAVVGRDRMPTFADRDQLPYITLVPPFLHLDIAK